MISQVMPFPNGRHLVLKLRIQDSDAGVRLQSHLPCTPGAHRRMVRLGKLGMGGSTGVCTTWVRALLGVPRLACREECLLQPRVYPHRPKNHRPYARCTRRFSPSWKNLHRNFIETL